MPRVDLKICDRVFILKVISTVQMTFASFTAILIIYLIVLQYWSSHREERSDIFFYKGVTLLLSIWDFGLGIILAFAANTKGLLCRRLLTLYTMIQTLSIPLSIFFLMKLYYKITKSKQKHGIDPHFVRLCLVQVGFFLCHFFFIAYVIDFAVLRKRLKFYDPSIRPKSVDAPTDPQITTTESRHIRFSESFMYQPSTSREIPFNRSQTSSQISNQEISVNECLSLNEMRTLEEMDSSEALLHSNHEMLENGESSK